MNPERGGVWLFGRFCYWSGGAQIGDFEVGESLRDVLFALQRVASRHSRRTNARFRGMAADDVVRLFFSALRTEGSAFASTAIEEQWGLLFAGFSMDVFDGLEMLLLEEGESERLIVVDWRSGAVTETRLELGEFDAVLEQAIAVLEAAHQTELGRSK